MLKIWQFAAIAILRVQFSSIKYMQRVLKSFFFLNCVCKYILIIDLVANCRFSSIPSHEHLLFLPPVVMTLNTSDTQHKENYPNPVCEAEGSFLSPDFSKKRRKEHLNLFPVSLLSNSQIGISLKLCPEALRMLFWFYIWIVSHCINTSCFLYMVISSGHLGCFCLKAIINNDAMNVVVWLSSQDPTLNFLGFLTSRVNNSYGNKHWVWKP